MWAIDKVRQEIWPTKTMAATAVPARLEKRSSEAKRNRPQRYILLVVGATLAALCLWRATIALAEWAWNLSGN
jgi:hypothetical protein